MRRHWLATAALLWAVPVAAQTLSADEAAIKAHVAFLAADSMHGREAGTRDYDIAADYVAARMLAAGLEPGGPDGSWFQPVPLSVATPDGQPVLTLTQGDRRETLGFLTDYLVRPSTAQATLEVSGPLVFAGYGIVDPSAGRDDYRGLDVRGRVVALLTSGPKHDNSEVAAHLSSRSDRARIARQKGAAGVVFLTTDQTEAVYGFTARARNWDSSAIAWANPDGRPRDDEAPTVGMFSVAGAAKLFAGSKLDWAAIRRADSAGRRVPTGPLATSLSLVQRSTIERVSSPNVVGRLPGSDPTLAAQTVVLSAHLDHVGVTKPDDSGDTINNGAMDNAAGIASMLEVARTLAAGPRPKRTILFVAVTAEEKGLIGSDYFAQHPTVAADGIVANVNLDMPILTFRFVDLVAYGADRSDIGTIAADAAGRRGIRLVPDPMPEEASFVRTDHYSFVRQGIPSVSLEPGPGGPGKAAIATFLDEHYHQPSDDLRQPFDWTAAKLFVDINADIARKIADAPDRPRWKRGDFFGTLYGGPMAD